MNNVLLDPELQKFVENEVTSGRFESKNEVLLEGVRLLRARQIHKLRQELLIGIEELDRGEGIVCKDDEELAKFFEEMAAELDCKLESR